VNRRRVKRRHGTASAAEKERRRVDPDGTRGLKVYERISARRHVLPWYVGTFNEWLEFS